MDDYIKRESLVADIEKAIQYTSALAKVPARDVLIDLKYWAENIPSADVAPVRHGEWKWSHGGECSVCGYRNSNFEYKYCPSCGAKMEVDG